jgi:hypothetical protein
MKPTLALARPSTSARTASAVAAKLAGQGTVRLVIEMSPATRKALKVKAAVQGTTIKAYLLALARQDGVDVQEVPDCTD